MNEKSNLIDARKLYKELKCKSHFADWIKRTLNKQKLEINQDYFIEEQKIRNSNSTMNTRKQYYLTKEASQKIISSKSINKILKEISENSREINIIKLEDEEYPEQLKKIKNPPKQLYIMGDVRNLKGNGIAIIGSRDCSNYGRRICKIFANNLAGYNLNIISGLAAGIDSCAHKACMEAGGKTIAVLPCGLKRIFPEENEPLLDEILKKGGTILTEYPPEFEKNQESCRERNRIVSGLAIATLVIEAEKRSGTSITVRNTREQNKKAFCIPSSLLNSKGIGTNTMIKENKAQIVTNVEDIIRELQEFKLEKIPNFKFKELTNKNPKKKKEEKAKENLKIDEENIEIYNFLSKEPKTIDEIVQALNKTINEITYKVTLLELEGVIEEIQGKKFKIK